MRGSFMGMRFSEFNIKTKDAVVADFERSDAGGLPFAGFQLEQEFLRVLGELDQFVEFLGRAFADDTALFHADWKFFVECAFNMAGQSECGVATFNARLRRMNLMQRRTGRNRLRESQKIAGIECRTVNFSKPAFHVAELRECLTEVFQG